MKGKSSVITRNTTLRNRVRMLCRRLGVDLVHFDHRPGSVNRPPVADMETVLEDLAARGLRCTEILDVGANCGEWSRLAGSIFPTARLYMIEPLTEMKSRLETVRDERPGSKVFLAGAGSQCGELPFTVMSDNLSASSFIPAAGSESAARGLRRSVPIVTIDSLIEMEEMPLPDLVKLDIQGFELEALKGASRVFGTTEVFIVEVSFFPFMSPGRACFHDVIEFMIERNYVCYDFAGFLRRPVDGALGQADAVFVKQDGFLRSSHRW